MSLIHARTNRPHAPALFLRDASCGFNDIPEVDRYGGGMRLGEALIAMKREAEGRTLLMKTHEFYTRIHGQQKPEAVRARRQLERLERSTPHPNARKN